jgi:acyl-CoA synthetase (AMP-forming)/AMP-acid ligase II
VQELGVQTAVVSGGASLAPHLEDFYEAAGLPVLNGWGLTETSPVIACRSLSPKHPAANVRGTVGSKLPGTSVMYDHAPALACQFMRYDCDLASRVISREERAEGPIAFRLAHVPHLHGSLP